MAKATARSWSRWKDWDKTWVSPAEFLAYRKDCKSFAEVGAWSATSVNLTGEAEPERVSAAAVSAHLFEALGVEPVLGRAFTEEEDLPGQDQVAILSYGLWQRRYGGEPERIGKTIQIDGRARTLLGVMPPDFKLPLDYQGDAGPTQIYVPLALDPKTAPQNRGNHGLFAAARLAPGVSAEQATAELKTMAARWTQEGLYPEEMRFEALALPVREEIVAGIRPQLLLLLGAVGLLLLIACANVANLFLARAEARTREVAVRAALGAGRGRLVRQLLTESAVLAIAGGTLGLALAFVGARVLLLWAPAHIPRLSEVTVDEWVLGFTLAVSLLTGILFGLAPALQASRPDLTNALKEGGLGSMVGIKRQWFRNSLVVIEVGLAVALLIGAGLLLRSFRELSKIDLGFDPRNVLTLRLSLPAASHPQSGDVTRFYDQLLERARALPAVASAGVVRMLPLDGTIGDGSLAIEGRPADHGDHPKGDWQVVSAGYFETMKTRLIAGRFITEEDRADSMEVAVVNETMARTYWPDKLPLGERFRMGMDPERPWITIVGVVGDERHNGVAEVIKEKFFRPHRQFPNSTGFANRTMTLLVRTDADPRALVRPVVAEIRALDANLPVSSVKALEEVVARAVAEPRFTTMLLGLFAGFSMLLAAVGIYGVLSYLVGQRFHEIGIRMALGASGREILNLVLRRSLALCALGVVLGVALALGLSRLMAGLLYRVGATDPATYLLTPIALGVVGLAASLIPARRATRVDPMLALRTE
jgi:putative ABC transport system permease protein